MHADQASAPTGEPVGGEGGGAPFLRVDGRPSLRVRQVERLQGPIPARSPGIEGLQAPRRSGRRRQVRDIREDHLGVRPLAVHVRRVHAAVDGIVLQGSRGRPLDRYTPLEDADTASADLVEREQDQLRTIDVAVQAARIEQAPGRGDRSGHRQRGLDLVPRGHGPRETELRPAPIAPGDPDPLANDTGGAALRAAEGHELEVVHGPPPTARPTHQAPPSAASPAAATAQGSGSTATAMIAAVASHARLRDR